MPIPIAAAMLGSAALGAGAGIYGSTRAADAQQNAAQQSEETARRNMLAQLMMGEPYRNVGHQALADMAGLYGYSTPAYTPAATVANALTPLSSRAIKRGLNSGMTVDQLAQSGTLGKLRPKALRRLMRAGVTPDEIAQLQGRQAMTAASTPAAVGSTGNNPQSLMERFQQMPGYRFGMQQGTEAVQSSAANRGGLFSGDTGKALHQFGQDYAGTKFGEEWNRLATLAGFGTAGTQAAGSALNAGTAATMAAQQQVGDARASGVLGATNSINAGLNSGWNNYLMQQYLDQQRQPAALSAYGPYAGGYRFPGRT